jgi:hypothetical protein
MPPYGASTGVVVDIDQPLSEDPTATALNSVGTPPAATPTSNNSNDGVHDDDDRPSSHRRDRRKRGKKASDAAASPSNSAIATTTTTTTSEIPRQHPQQQQQQRKQLQEQEGDTITDYGNRSGLGIIGDTVDFGCTTGTAAGVAAASNRTISDIGNDNTEFIDNRNLTYIPIRLACGNTVLCSPQTLAACPMILRSLQIDITEALKVLPRSVHKLVQRTNIWVNASYEYGNKRDPYVLHHSTTHHSATWLTEIANDISNKTRSIEIYNCFEYERMRYHWNGCGLLLHELCHIIHQHCVDDGLENATINDLFQRADRSGLYECVLRRDWAGRTQRRAVATSSSRSRSSMMSSSSSSSSSPRSPTGGSTSSNITTALEQALIDDGEEEQEELEPADTDLAYAMVDKKEFFAEMSVAFLSDAYHALDKGDCRYMVECCPPILEPSVLARVVHQPHPAVVVSPYADSDDGHDGDDVNERRIHGDGSDSCWTGFFKECQKLFEMSDVGRRRLLLLPAVEPSSKEVLGTNSENSDDKNTSERRRKRNVQSLMIDVPLQDAAIRQNCANVKHCNKFYPFTRGQLQHYDPGLYVGIQNIWRDIVMWDDPLAKPVKLCATNI